jgi:type II secretory pathway component PulF
METGVGMIEGLADIELQLTKPAMKRVVQAIRRDIEAGEPLSAALAKHPKVFGDFYVNVVTAGEATGRIDQALDDLVAQLEWQSDLGSRIREVATYPVIVIVMLTILATVLVGFTRLPCRDSATTLPRCTAPVSRRRRHCRWSAS